MGRSPAFSIGTVGSDSSPSLRLTADLCAVLTADDLESTLLAIALAASNLAEAAAAIFLPPDSPEGSTHVAIASKTQPPVVLTERLRLDNTSFGVSSSRAIRIGEADDLARALNLDTILPGWSYPVTALPLCSNGSVAGLLLANTPNDNMAARVGGEALALLVEQAAIAIRRARARDDLLREVNDLSSLMSLDDALASDRNYDSTVGQIVDRVKRLVDVERVDVVLYDSERDALVWDRTSKAGHDASITLPLSTPGISEHVFRTGQAYVSNDLPADELAIQQFVRSNQSRQVIAVPLDAGGRRIGVLRVFNKLSGDFTGQDLQLVSLLGAHLGLHFYNARLLEDARQTVANVTRLNEVIERQQEGLRYVLTVHDELTRMVLDGEGIPMIVTTLSRLLARAVAVEDRFASVIAQDAPGEVVQGRPWWRARSSQSEENYARIALADWDRGSRPVRLDPSTYRGLDRPCIVAPIAVERVTMGYLYVSESEGSLEEIDLMAVERAAIAIALQMMKEKSAADARHKVKGDFIGELLSERSVDEPSLRKRAALLGIDLTVPRTVLALEMDGLSAHSNVRYPERHILAMKARLVEVIERACTRLAPEAVVVPRSDEIVVLARSLSSAPAERPGQMVALADSLRNEAARWLMGISISVGVGDSCETLEEYGKSYKRARQALDMARASRQSDVTVTFDSVGVYGMLLENHNRDKLLAFVDHTLGKLLQPRIRHAEELRETLDRYLSCDCHLERTADLLHIHANTLRNRLERIEQITGMDLNRLECRVNLELAFKAQRFLALQSGASV